MAEGASQPAIDELKGEIRALKDALRMTEGYKRDLTNIAEKVILESPIVTMGKWFLLLAIVTGMAVWVGGSIYGGIQVKSIADRTDEILGQFDKKMKERTKQIDDDTAEARGKIKEQETAVVVAAKDAVAEAGNEKNLVREKLAVDQLPDIRQLKEQLEAIARLVGNSTSIACLYSRGGPSGCSLGLRLSRFYLVFTLL